ncbi:LLM class flavin-dependent oxidoreductase [Amycolatopsis cihanbeyliensis]|uniref:Alkanesulfonate monooxygenase SsuD/methylene tetrahydromethanopterin reductase-like flavin-dependent oxidoreductase (Luciferase family) n=1 Tax=Amycolatopsis cihanbeyliensis TaxID=1128664 RepID=A0A542DLC2_AMYCI|nr:LLM class flavin-dependent oxidoreductase [Amycolatopsis cihanbeyliensis]TQJ03902.1 alkanesulfonate monooxygenase SsuD/methylene tetrahydromethanopterin reductase-like flavin-dependent oxidoreductase (luciferase family) [Amycolatopsis cihanbeyliensis]
MRFGIFLVTGRFAGQDDAAALRRSAEAVVAAERAGFDDVWLAEHHFMPYGVCPSATTFAGHALGRTSRIEVGTAVSVLSTVHPIALAEQCALLTTVSGGRFRLGVGRGGPWLELEVFGTGTARYDHGFAEGLDLLLTAMTEDRAGAAGEHFSFREVPMVPRVPGIRPPVVACGSPDSQAVRLAARRGLPMLLGLHADDEEKARTVAAYRALAGTGGAEPAGGHVSTVLCQVADDPEQALRQVRAALPGWLGPGLDAHVPVDGRQRGKRDPVAYTERLCAIHPVGSPADCVARLREGIRRTGISHVIMLVEATGAPESTLANIERIGAEVLPALRG